MPTTTDNCGNCRFWFQRPTSGGGTCQRFPPARVNDTRSWSPLVTADFWCGEHRRPEAWDQIKPAPAPSLNTPEMREGMGPFTQTEPIQEISAPVRSFTATSDAKPTDKSKADAKTTH